jgi:hypothetical protein
MQNNIKLLILPALSSQFTQSLCIGLFSPLEEYLSQALSPFISANAATLRKAEWFEAFINVRLKTFSETNVLGSWKGAGLQPFNPKTVPCRIIPATTPSPPSSPLIQTMSTPKSSFRQAIGSPFDANKLRAWKSDSNEMLRNDPGVTTPLRECVSWLMDAVEGLRTRVHVLETEIASKRMLLYQQEGNGEWDTGDSEGVR